MCTVYRQRVFILESDDNLSYCSVSKLPVTPSQLTSAIARGGGEAVKYRASSSIEIAVWTDGRTDGWIAAGNGEFVLQQAAVSYFERAEGGRGLELSEAARRRYYLMVVGDHHPSHAAVQD